MDEKLHTFLQDQSLPTVATLLSGEGGEGGSLLKTLVDELLVKAVLMLVPHPPNGVGILPGGTSYQLETVSFCPFLKIFNSSCISFIP